jgi:hypothetical protein
MNLENQFFLNSADDESIYLVSPQKVNFYFLHTFFISKDKHAFAALISIFNGGLSHDAARC